MSNFKKISSEAIVLSCLLFLLFIVILSFNAISVNEQHFSQLANSFLHGQAHFLSDVPYTANTSDIVFFNNNFYWSLGPFPAILLMPFVAFANLLGFFFFQGYLNIILVLLVFYLIFCLYENSNNNRCRSGWFGGGL